MSTMDHTNRELIAQYLSGTDTRKLHVGCGSHLLSGWLNSDYFPLHSGVIKLDAMGSYPFEDETFDYVFSEHIIEHVPFRKGEQMLREQFRILKERGRIRVSTPDLRFLFAILSEPNSRLHDEYIKWATSTFIRDAPHYHPTFVINNFMRAWGHQFIYDETVLRLALERVGFTDVKKCALSLSDDPALSNLENEERMPEGFLRLESIVLEGSKVSLPPSKALSE